MSRKSNDKAAESSKSIEGAKVLKTLKTITEKPVKDSTPGYHSSWGTGTPSYISSAVKSAEAKAK